MLPYIAFLLILSPLEINSRANDVTRLPSPRYNSLSRVVGGDEAQQDEFPYLAMLTRINGYVFCGGALISDYYVITAAHCVDKKLASGIMVRLGEHDWGTSEEGEHVEIAVKEKIAHPKFFRPTAYNDIALLRLNVIAPKRIKRVCLSSKEMTSGETITIAGWGATDYNTGLPTQVLRKLDMEVLDTKSCKDNLGGMSMFVNDQKICAWAENKDSCKGDSGGPVLWGETNDKLQVKERRLVGVISMGFQCGMANLPAINTRLTSYFDWIKNSTKGDDTICWV